MLRGWHQAVKTGSTLPERKCKLVPWQGGPQDFTSCSPRESAPVRLVRPMLLRRLMLVAREPREALDCRSLCRFCARHHSIQGKSGKWIQAIVHTTQSACAGSNGTE